MSYSTVKAYGVTSKTSPVQPLDIKRRAVGPHDVEINIEWSGVCHSDLHNAHGDWREPTFPLVTGHEIVGKVASVGDQVTAYKPGDTVGVGCLVDSCQSCKACKADSQQFCSKMLLTFGSPDPDFGGMTAGGYSQKIIVRDDYVLRIPKNIYGPGAAPLLCAGITSFSPLDRWGIKKGDKVGIAGYGGLGHMGVKFAAAMGADVYIFTTSESKARNLSHIDGVKGAIVTTNQEEVAKHNGTFDFILNTIPVSHNYDVYTSLLDFRGKQILVGVLNECKTNPASIIRGSKIVAGSLIGGIQETQKMLDFCGEKNIVSDVEVTDIQHINNAWRRVQENDVRFRFVIDISSLEKPVNVQDQAIQGIPTLA